MSLRSILLGNNDAATRAQNLAAKKAALSSSLGEVFGGIGAATGAVVMFAWGLSVGSPASGLVQGAFLGPTVGKLGNTLGSAIIAPAIVNVADKAGQAVGVLFDGPAWVRDARAALSADQLKAADILFAKELSTGHRMNWDEVGQLYLSIADGKAAA